MQLLTKNVAMVIWMHIGGSYSDVVAEISNQDTLGGEEVESSELLNEQGKRKRVYPSAGVCVYFIFILLYIL